MLSNVDIVRELGKNILIFPFNEDNLKGASYNLTASKYAWDVTTKKRVFEENSNKIILAANSTTVIETNETIWVSKKIAGSYHSKVILVSKGTGHIGTTLDPEYIGCSLIAIHNFSSNPIELTPEIDTFVTIVFEYVNEASSLDKHNNQSGRLDIFRQLGLPLTSEEERYFQKEFMIDPKKLRLEVLKSEGFTDIQAKYVKWYIEIPKKYSVYFVSLILIIILFLLNYNQAILKNKPWYSSSQSLVNTLTVVFITLASKQFIDDLKR
jgi:deoxycytidine triphosphate deaminase